MTSGKPCKRNKQIQYKVFYCEKADEDGSCDKMINLGRALDDDTQFIFFVFHIFYHIFFFPTTELFARGRSLQEDEVGYKLNTHFLFIFFTCAPSKAMQYFLIHPTPPHTTTTPHPQKECSAIQPAFQLQSAYLAFTSAEPLW